MCLLQGFFYLAEANSLLMRIAPTAPIVQG